MKTRRFWLGLGVSLAFLALFVARIDLGEMARALGRANYVFVLPGLALYVVAVWFRTWRWKFLLGPLRPLPVRRLFPVVVVGYMANNLLPVRLGEVVRSYYLGEREGVSKTATLATIVVERVFDGLALLFFLAAAALFLPLVGLLGDLGQRAHLPVWALVSITVAPFLVVLALLVGMALFPGPFRRTVGYLLRPLPARLAARAGALAGLFAEGLGVLRSPRRLLVVFVLSVPVWLFEAAMYYVIAFSFGLEGFFTSVGTLAAAIVMVTATSNLATSLPSSQGGIGPFEFFAAATLAFLGVEASVASAYAVALHVVLLVPVTVAGLLYLWAENLSLAQLAGQKGPKGTSAGRRRAGQAALPPEGKDMP